MKKLYDYYRQLEKECSLCKANFNVWVSDLNFEQDQEEGIKNHLFQHCPACQVVEKLKKD